MTWPIEEKPITELYLDQKNIRTPISEADQNALIRDMFDNENAFDIAKSYSRNGIFPDEFPIGIVENKKIILIEGNRRLAALKALSEPSIVPSWQRKVQSLNNPNITHIRIVIAPSRELAISHIANKHTADYRRPWKPLRQAYFYKSQLDNGKKLSEIIEEFPDHNIPRFIKMLEIHHLANSVNANNALAEKIEDERGFPITNLERFYNDSNVQNFLGISFDPTGKIIGKIDKEEFSKGFRKIVEDVATGTIDSRYFNTSKERKKYLREFPVEIKPDVQKKGSFTASDFNLGAKVKSSESRTESAKASDSKKTSIGSRKSSPTPKGLFRTSEIPFKLSNTSLKLMYLELSRIDVSNFPNATHDLLRSFLECALVFYFKETGDYSKIAKNEQHNPKLSEMLIHIMNRKCSTIQDEHIIQNVEHVKKDYADSYSLERMNMINHNEHWNSSEKDVRSAWGKLEALVKVILNPKG